VVRQKDSEFWADFAADMEDPEFRDEFLRTHAHTLTIDRIVNLLDEQREVLGLSKAELARRLQTSAPWVRRLFSAKGVNPTLSTLAEVAAALGLQVTLEPLPAPAPAKAPKTATTRRARTA